MNLRGTKDGDFCQKGSVKMTRGLGDREIRLTKEKRVIQCSKDKLIESVVIKIYFNSINIK